MSSCQCEKCSSDLGPRSKFCSQCGKPNGEHSEIDAEAYKRMMKIYLDGIEEEKRLARYLKRARAKIKVDFEAGMRQVELDKLEDDNDLDTLTKLQKIKAKKEADRAALALKAAKAHAELESAAAKQCHEQTMEVLAHNAKHEMDLVGTIVEAGASTPEKEV